MENYKQTDVIRLTAGGRYSLDENSADRVPISDCEENNTSIAPPLIKSCDSEFNVCDNKNENQNSSEMNLPMSCSVSARYAQNPPCHNQNLFTRTEKQSCMNKLCTNSESEDIISACAPQPKFGSCSSKYRSQDLASARNPKENTCSVRPTTCSKQPRNQFTSSQTKLNTCFEAGPSNYNKHSSLACVGLDRRAQTTLPHPGPTTNFSVSACSTARSFVSYSKTPLKLLPQEKSLSCDPSPQISNTESGSSVSYQNQAEELEKAVNNICCGTKHNNRNNRNLFTFIDEMNKVFLDRLCDVEKRVPYADAVKASIYREWVEMSNSMILTLLSAISTLETDASCRIAELEKLIEEQSESKNSSSLNDECEIKNLKNDVSSLLELIKRANQEGKWNFEGLEFKTVNQNMIIGDNCSIPKSNSSISLSKNFACTEANSPACPKKNSSSKLLPEFSGRALNNCPTPNIPSNKSISDRQLEDNCSIISKEITTMNPTLNANSLSVCETSCLQLLKNELEELLKCQTDISSAQKKRFNCQLESCQERFEELNYEVTKHRNKLKFVNKQLENIADDKGGLCEKDSGYKSQEDLQPEKSNISRVVRRINKLKEDNTLLRSKVKNLCKSIEDTHSNCKTKSNILEKNKKILDSVATHLSGLCGNAISVQALLFDDDFELPTGVESQKIDKTTCDICNEPTPFCEAIDKLEKALCERESTIKKMNECQTTLKKQLTNCERNLQCERNDRDADLKTLQHEMCIATKTIQGLELVTQKFSGELCDSEEHNKKLTNHLSTLEENNIQLANENEVLRHELCELNCGLVNLEEKLGRSNPPDNYRKPLTPLQIPSPSQFLLTTTTNQTITNPITTISSASIPQQQELTHNNSNYNLSKQLTDQPEIRRLSNEEHQEYRNIINDLTNELVDLTSQVSLVHDKFDSTDTSKPFEKTLKEFELQNDLLQKTIQALETSIAEKDKIIADKTANQLNSGTTVRKLFEDNQNYVDQVKSFQLKCNCGAAELFGSPAERRKKNSREYGTIFQLLDQKTIALRQAEEQACTDSTSLKKEILDLQEENKKCHINFAALQEKFDKKECELEKMQTLLKQSSLSNVNKEIIKTLQGDLEKEKSRHKDEMHKLKSELQSLRKHLEQQKSSFAKQSDVTASLEKRIANYRIQNENAQKENIILQEEIFSLKERLACSEGTERSLKEQIYKSQEELVNARCDLQKINAYSEEIDSYKKNNSKLKESNSRLVRDFNQLIEDYNELHENYTKIYDLNNLYLGELQHFRKWQIDQAETDKMSELKLEQMIEHIRILANDRENLIKNCNDMYKDTFILASMFEKFKANDEITLSTPTQFIGDGTSVNSPHQIISMLQKTTTKLHHTTKAWNEQSHERRNSE